MKTFYSIFRPYDGSEDITKYFSSQKELDQYIENNNHNGCGQIIEKGYIEY